MLPELVSEPQKLAISTRKGSMQLYPQVIIWEPLRAVTMYYIPYTNAEFWGTWSTTAKLYCLIRTRTHGNQ